MFLGTVPARLSRHHRVAFAIATGVLCLAGVLYWFNREPPPVGAGPFKIGFQESPPYQMVTGDRSPAGPAIEIVSEAVAKACNWNGSMHRRGHRKY
jgi:hypothetical protein